MNTEFFTALELIAKQRNIPTQAILESVETAITNAYKKDRNGNIKITFNADKKELRVTELREVVEQVEDPDTQISLAEAKEKSKKYKLGDIYETDIPLKQFSRIGAQTAKQMIMQNIRETERNMLIEQYEDKKGELISATVYRTDTINGSVVLDTGTSKVSLRREEQIPGERYVEGDIVKVYIMEVRRETRGPVITISRTHPGLVRRLLELEVPEIQSGVVTIENIVREAGSRTKISVTSNDPDVDPVGACVGEHGKRIADIGKELGGEKIDVVKYSDDPAEYIASALAPAEVRHVLIESEHLARVGVDESQLSLAIGKEGQNARLAARLTGFKIDIKPDDGSMPIYISASKEAVSGQSAIGKILGESEDDIID